jgi:hypothetical protein
LFFYFYFYLGSLSLVVLDLVCLAFAEVFDSDYCSFSVLFSSSVDVIFYCKFDI